MAGAYSDKLTHKDHSPAVVPGRDPIPDKPEPCDDRTQKERKEELEDLLNKLAKLLRKI